MSTRLSEFLVISRGQWDRTSSKEDIQAAIDEFYGWLTRCISEGTMVMGSRLSHEGATVSKASIVMDGPFGEAKEVIGGYWIIKAGSLEDAVAIAALNPCLEHGIYYEIRPLESECASAYRFATETPR